MTSNVTGISEAVRAMGAARVKDAIKIQDGLSKCGDVILKKANLYCPVEFGPLRASGKKVVTGTGLGATVTVEYGGPGAPYALYVHEDLTKYHAPPTCAQWLVKAIRETRGTTASIVRREIVGTTSVRSEAFQSKWR